MREQGAQVGTLVLVQVVKEPLVRSGQAASGVCERSSRSVDLRAIHGRDWEPTAI